ncbi:unnamed protein product [Caenorhabditis brenneri]
MNTIPLHLLPDVAYILALRNMEIYDQLAYSLCTKNTKKAVKSLKLTAEEINLYISDDIEFEFRFKNSIAFWGYMRHGNEFPNEEFRIPDMIEVTVYRRLDKETEWEWNFQNIGVKDWLNHFYEVLHHPRIDDLCFDDNQINNDFIKPVQKVIEGLQLVSFGLAEGLTPEFMKKALESFHNYEELYIDPVPFDSPEVYKIDKFLVQNLSKLCIPGAERLHIDQVLLANCEKLKLHSSMVTDKDLKIFVKLWICGSNPRLKYFFTRREDLPEQQNRPFDEEVFFKGIKRTKIPLDSQEVYIEQVNENYNEETQLAGGSRIRRHDGTTAVVLIRGHSFSLIVDV